MDEGLDDAPSDSAHIGLALLDRPGQGTVEHALHRGDDRLRAGIGVLDLGEDEDLPHDPVDAVTGRGHRRGDLRLTGRLLAQLGLGGPGLGLVEPRDEEVERSLDEPDLVLTGLLLPIWSTLPDKATSVVVLLHGYGADRADLLGLADPLSPHLPGTAFHAPDAPEPCANNPMGRQWFPIPWLDGSTEAQARAAALPVEHHFVHEPVPGEPGWWTWTLADPTRFNSAIGPLAIRYAAAGEPGLVRMLPRRAQGNLGDNIHGGATLTFIDIALFAGSRACGVDLGDRPVTLDISCLERSWALRDRRSTRPSCRHRA